MGNESSRKTYLVPLILLILVAALAVVVIQQRREISQIREQIQQPAQVAERPVDQSEALPASEPAAPSAAAPVAAPATPAAETAATQQTQEELVATPTGMAAPPKDTGLTLTGTDVVPTEGGLRATMKFNTSKTGPLGLVAIVVRLPRDGSSRILAFGPSDPTSFAGIAQRVSDDGKFAVFEGTPGDVAAIEFALSVSDAAIADVRGTTGIGAFDLVIGASGATVRNK